MWRRKLEAGGDWYAQARDGAWSRWDQRASDWVPAPDGPPGGASPLEPELPAAVYAARPASPTGGLAWDFVSTFVGVTTPAFFALIIAFVVTAVFAFIWNGFLAPWWGPPIHPSRALLPIIAGVISLSFFLATGITIVRMRGAGALALAVGVVAAGAAATLLLVSRLTGLGPVQVLTSRNTFFAVLMIAISWAGLALRRWLAEI